MPSAKMIKRNFATAASSSGKEKKSIRVHGSGNFVVASEYKVGDPLPQKYVVSDKYLRKAIDDDVPIWIDTDRMSPVQLASVFRTVKKMNTGDREVAVSVVVRDGRKMVLARRKKGTQVKGRIKVQMG